MRLCFSLLCCLFPALALAGEDVHLPETVGIDFLYVNANTDEAAGGHTALRFGDTVFHYQFFPDGSFLLVREPWDSFRFLYNELHNRSIAIASLPLHTTVTIQIRNHFTELLVSQQQFFEEMEQIREEEHVIRKLLNGNSEISVNCLGFFSKTGKDDQQNILREQIEAKLGRRFLQREVARANGELQQLVHDVNRGERSGTNFHEALGWYEALLVLEQGRGLDEKALLPVMAIEEELNAGEKQVLERFADHLSRSIVDLLQSTRPDKGESLLLQTARYLAVKQSLTSGKFLSLDPFHEDLRVIQLIDTEMEGDRLKTLQDELLAQAEKRRDLFMQEDLHPEIAYSLLETSRARAWELSQVSDSRHSVRLLNRVTLPSRAGTVALDLSPGDVAGLRGVAEILERELAVLQQKSKDLYGYNLFVRNCATELLRSLNTTFPDRESGEAAMGGWLEADDGLVFIPFLFYDRAVAAFHLQEEQFLPARRLRNLATLYEQDLDLTVWLRESNTLSSTLYEPKDKDTPFLFFTDDSFLLRPIQGVLNIGYAALHGAAGIVTVPVDEGRRFNQAARGIFYSLPELVFGNIRKGSYLTVHSEPGP